MLTVVKTLDCVALYLINYLTHFFDDWIELLFFQGVRITVNSRIIEVRIRDVLLYLRILHKEATK